MEKKKSTARSASKPAPTTDQAERLIRLRLMLGYETATAMAVFLDIIQQRWSNFENGTPLSQEIAIRLVQSVPGLTLDWLYFGKPDGLPLELARRLGEVGPPGKRST